MTYKLIILGPQCSGKTTLVRYLREHYPDLAVMEEEEVFMEMNGGKYPKDHEYKEKVMRPKLNEKLKQMENTIFLSSYCEIGLLKELKLKGFKIIQLVLDKDEFDRRNERRMKEEKYPDARVWAEKIFDYHQNLRNDSLIDQEIDAKMPIEEISRDILKR